MHALEIETAPRLNGLRLRSLPGKTISRYNNGDHGK
jgi:hypothetical protein